MDHKGELIHNYDLSKLKAFHLAGE